MAIVFQSYERIEKLCREEPGWWGEVGKAALCYEDPAYGPGGFWFNADHPLWVARQAAQKETRLAAMDPAARALIEKQIGGCVGCGEGNPMTG